MAYKFERQGPKFEGLDGVDPHLLPYIKDALQWNYNLQWDIFENIKGAYEQFIIPIVFYLEHEKGKFKGIDERIDSILKLSRERLAKSLQLIIYESLKHAVFIARSPISRLELDKLISFNLDELKIDELKIDELKDEGNNPTFEIAKLANPTGEEKQNTKDKINYKINLVQSNEIKHAEHVAKNTLDKKRVFDNKEFKLSGRIWDITGSNLADIKRIIRENQNVDCVKIAKLLEKYQQTDSVTTCKQYPSMMARLKGRVAGTLSFEAFRLARNECAEIAFQESLESYKNNPYIEAVKWLLSNNRNPKYEKLCKCNDIAYEDNYGLGEGVYPKDAVPSRPHVMCLCTIAPITGRQFKKALKEGLKLGNVPQDWWLEEKKKLDEIRESSPEEKQYRLQFKTQNEQKKEYIGEVKKADWFQNGVKDEHKNIFLNDLFNTNEKILRILAEHTRQMKVDLYNNDGYGSRYNPRENKIYCNLWTDRLKGDNKAIGFKLGTKTFLYETGHWLDYNRFRGDGLRIGNKMPELASLIKKDVINYINKTGTNLYQSNYKPIAKITLENIDNLPHKIKETVITNIIQNRHINSNISDLYGAVTYNKLHGGYKHEIDYWKYKYPLIHDNKIISEGIAEMFESLANGSLRINAMEAFLPTSWQYFNEIWEKVF